MNTACRALFRSMGTAVAVVTACLASPVAVQACNSHDSYGAYTLCCLATGARPSSVSTWLLVRKLAGSTATGYRPNELILANETPGNPLACGPYTDERVRHDALRGRAEILSQNPRMRRYQSRIDDLRADDDRRIKAFDLRARSAGGSATALPGLKCHDDKLEKMLARAQVLVGR